ncbi:glycosyltransferase [Pseudomonadota bacterium]
MTTQTDFSNKCDQRLLFPLVASNSPSGGRKFVYHVVDFLNEDGIEAWVVHPVENFRLTWFENDTQVGYSSVLFPKWKKRSRFRRFKDWVKSILRKPPFLPDKLVPKLLVVNDDDILVLPETRLLWLHLFPSKCQKVIFNQNPYFTFAQHFNDECFSVNGTLSKKLLGILVVSTINENIQNFVFPEIEIVQASLFVEDVFCFSKNKKNQIAYMPRRNAKDAQAVINMLKFRGLPSNIEIVPIDGMHQDEVAKVLSESLIFLSFADREGFGLPAAEAMACGCMVIGYSGNGGDEFFDSEYCYPIREGDIEGFVRAVEEVLKINHSDPERCERKRALASQVIRKRYSKEVSRQTIVAAFRQLSDT